MSPRVYAILGPTASGKTNLAMELVQRFPFEIISVDSAMIYKGMDIGTATPTAEELAIAPHRLIDICDPADIYNAADFCTDALAAINEIIASGKWPLLVGGTMMYFNALVNGIADLPDRDESIRASFEGIELSELHQRLKAIDPDAAAMIKPTDPQRIYRALEVYEITGQPISTLQATTQSKLTLPLSAIGLMPEDKSWLNERIEQRFDMMLDAGFIEEVVALKDRGDLSLDLPSMRCVGYRQVWQMLDGEFDSAAMREQGIIATRQLAKRQRTWLRKFDWAELIDPMKMDVSQVCRLWGLTLS